MCPTRKEYLPLKEKTFENALIKLFQSEFGFLGGPAVIKLIVNRISDLVEEYYPRKERLHFGQMLWFAIDKDEKKNHQKGMKTLKLKPVILSLVTPSDIQDYINNVKQKNMIKKVIARLHNESFEQHGVLAEHDTAIILHRSTSTISQNFIEYQKETGKILPSRGTIHDLGNAITHKEIIVRKYLTEGKESPMISREVDHSIVASDRYIKHSNQVDAALRNGVPTDEIPHVTGLSKRLVDAYIKLLLEISNEKRHKKVRMEGDSNIQIG